MSDLLQDVAARCATPAEFAAQLRQVFSRVADVSVNGVRLYLHLQDGSACTIDRRPVEAATTPAHPIAHSPPAPPPMAPPAPAPLTLEQQLDATIAEARSIADGLRSVDGEYRDQQLAQLQAGDRALYALVVSELGRPQPARRNPGRRPRLVGGEMDRRRPGGYASIKV